MTPEEETKKFYEKLESIAIAQGLEMLLRQTEQNRNDDPAHMAMIVFFRSLLTKYRRKVGTVRLEKDDFGKVELIDDSLKTFYKN